MGKSKENKSPKKSKLFRLPDDVIETLAAEKETSGRTETQILTDKVRGKDRFLPEVEKIIEAEMTATGRSRDEVIQFAVLDYHGPQSELLAQGGFAVGATIKARNNAGDIDIAVPSQEKAQPTAKTRGLLKKTFKSKG